MNYASWNSKSAAVAARKINRDVLNVLSDPDKSPDITNRLLAMDEAQLDKLTGMRAKIFVELPER